MNIKASLTALCIAAFAVTGCDVTVTSSPYASCLVGGDTYLHGESWSDDCNSCSCDDGLGVCTAMACAELGVGTLVVTNDLDWNGVLPDLATTYIANSNYETNVGGPGTEQGFSVQDIPEGEYTVTVTDTLDVDYVFDLVPVMSESETQLSVIISYAQSGAIELTNGIDNLDGDEVYVVGMYATDPNSALVDLSTEYNWLQGAEVDYEGTALAIGIAGGTYQIVIADFDDNYYVLYDVPVTNGAVTSATVTAQDRDPELTLALN